MARQDCHQGRPEPPWATRAGADEPAPPERSAAAGRLAPGGSGGGMADAEFARRRAAELAQIGAARAQSTDAAGWRQPFAWPLRGAIRGRFGAQRVYQGKPGSYHGGLDIAGAEGTPFMAPADGVVVLAAATPFTLEGNLLILDHGSGLSSAFLHASRLGVRPGGHVRQGQVIGWVGRTGRATGPHLHWAIKWREAKLDPLLFVSPQP